MSQIDIDSLNQQLQRSIAVQYELTRQQGKRPYAEIRESGFRVYSQCEEDGIILYVLTMIGVRSRRVVEMCCGNAHRCMASNLILNHSFEGFLFDGAETNIIEARRFFAGKPDSCLFGPALKQAWITVENVNDLLRDNDCTGEVDLLALDIDGNDYWVWRAINAITPRLVVIEAHNIIPADCAVVHPYEPYFCYTDQEHPDFMGASALAMIRLGRRLGYRPIGANRHGFNLFFLRNGEGQDFFPEVSAASILDNPWSRDGRANRWPLVRHLPWVEVVD